MKMKMRVIPKGAYTPNMPITGTDKATRNHLIQNRITKSAKALDKKKKADAALVASWFKPSKYKGFKAKIK
jgi:hypothetical protein